MDNPHLVDVTKRPQPEFKRHPFKLEETDHVGVVLSSVPHGALHVEGVRSFYHYKLEDMDVAVIYEQYRSLCNEHGSLQEQFRSVTNKGF